MEIESIRDCLKKIDDMIFDKTLKYMIKDDLELIMKHIVSQQADVISKDKLCILLVLQQINCIIERFYSDDSEEILNDEYNDLREKILYWYETINAKPKKKFYFKGMRYIK